MTIPEHVIEEKLMGMEAEPFQRLAEYYACITEPDKYKALVPKGRNFNHQTTPGWPDAIVVSNNGVHAVEATRALRGKWKAHMENDLQRAKTECLASFLFVALDEADDAKRIEYMDKWHAQGVTAKLVFRSDLVRELAQSRFARVWVELLDLPSAPLPFVSVRDTPWLFGRADGEHFAPTLDDYLCDRVHPSCTLRKVEGRLEADGWALVRGHGAVGKTVLGLQIALGGDYAALPSYYLDLSEIDDDAGEQSERALRAIATFGDDRVLFVLDNVHLNEKAAWTIYDHWSRYQNGSRILMLGRSISEARRYRAYAPPLKELENPDLELEANSTDLIGILQRLASRQEVHLASPVSPPPSHVERWHRLFAGDLIVFSAAVTHRMSSLLRGDWDLSENHAVDYVRDRYLGTGVTQGERANLVRLAALSGLEVRLPSDALDDPGFPETARNGIVLASGHGRDWQYERFRLVHSGLGRLILAAAPGTIDVRMEWASIAVRSPFCGGVLASILSNNGDEDSARDLLKDVVSQQDWLPRAIGVSGLHSAIPLSKLLVRLGILSIHDFSDEFRLSWNLLATRLQSGGLAQLLRFLRYAERALPDIWEMSWVALQEPREAEKLTATALASTSDLIAGFISDAHLRWQTVATRLDECLKCSVDSLSRSVCESSLSGLTALLGVISFPAQLVTAIDKDAWEANWRGRAAEPPHYFHSLSKMLNNYGRTDLLEAPACAMIRTENPHNWDPSHNTIRDISHLLRIGHTAPQADVARFLDLLLTDEWLDRQCANAHVCTWAAALFSIWGYHGRSVASRFVTAALQRRLGYTISTMDTIGAQELSESLQLLGALSVVVGVADCSHARWPSAQQLNAAIDHADTVGSGRCMDTIGFVQVQLWVGLREMARLRRFPEVCLSSVAGDSVLSRWLDSEPPTDRHRALNDVMLPWLGKCAAKDWTLVAESAPLDAAM